MNSEKMDGQVWGNVVGVAISVYFTQRRPMFLNVGWAVPTKDR
ncbi:hypothetical protein D1AOALGA4SA_7634 [Olavius algarvensis Delta 1 endosymbiont]|nr:hypothetical protein D1AOALGA4SA_7634 [Olavius algarvensis Delta 1 endosymbiont]